MAGRLDRQDPMHYLPVAERFVSVNGEGPNAGTIAAFVRLVGCNLSCSYCDTRWACDRKCPCEWLDAVDIARWVEETGAHRVTLTGGEPLIHPIVGDLLRILVRGEGPKDSPVKLPDDLRVEIETNGSVSLDKIQTLLRFLPRSQAERISFTVDYKLPSSGMEPEMDLASFKSLTARDAVKFVVGDAGDLERMREVAARLGLLGRVPVFASPVYGQMDPAEIAAFMIENKLYDVRLQLQLHKAIWPGVERGV